MRWHVCPYCTKEFRKPSDLVRHIRIHTHEKPFKCPQCFRAFAVKSTLTAHIKTHTGIKAFKCQHCMKSFSTSGSLKVHIRLHTGRAHRWLPSAPDTWIPLVTPGPHVGRQPLFCRGHEWHGQGQPKGDVHAVHMGPLSLFPRYLPCSPSTVGEACPHIEVTF